MIDFEPFYKTLEKRGKTGYALQRDKVVGSGTLTRMKAGKSISTDTIDDICNYLRCKPSDIMRYTPGDKPAAPPDHTTE